MSSALCLPFCFLLLMIFPVEQLQYRFPVNDVDSCPSTNQSWYRAGVRLNCSHDANNRFQYLCIPNQDKTALLEFCYDKIMRLYEEGHCLHLSNSGILNQDNCTSFKEGCPPKPYFSSEIFLFQKCLSINTEFRCYQEDSHCPLKNQTKMTKGTGNTTTPETTGLRSDTTATLLFLTLTLLLLLLILFAFLLWRRRRRIRWLRHMLLEEKRDMPVDVCQSMNNLCFKHHMEIMWKKDGRQLQNDDRHSSEVEVDSERRFIIYNVNEEDTGTYKGIAEHRRLETHPFDIEIETLNLYGPVNIYMHDKNKHKSHLVRSSPQERILNLICYSCSSYHQRVNKDENSGWTTIWSSQENKDNPCYVLVTKFNKTLSKSSNNIFTNDAEKKLLFHVALLLSKNRSLQRNTKDAQSCFTAAEKFFLYSLEDPAYDYCFREANEWVNSISVSQDTATFVNDETEMLTLWTLLQNCQIPKHVVEYIFVNRLTYLCVKYFRLHGYKRHENEACIYLPPSFEDKYLECLIEDYILKLDDGIENSFTEIEGDFDQRSSSVFKCIMYCCFIIDKGSKELISKYFRTSGYLRKKDELCMCVPTDVTRSLIKRIGIDIMVHETILDISCHQTISEIHRVPEEILKWELEARQRFLENFQRGNVPVYRTRCLIVGCAGAGKTTLLRHLQRKENKASSQSPESTKGLDVYENLFTIGSSKDKKKDTLYDYNNESMSTIGCFKRHRGEVSDDPHLLSVMDFAGQVAYYACHQVYFSRRAIYLLVVDMSQDLTAEMGDIERDNVKGSLFEHWSLQDYFGFWVQTIRTYGEDSSQKDDVLGKDDSRNASSPVIVIATHKDCIQTTYTKGFGENFYEKLTRGVPKTIKDFFNDRSHKYYELELPPKQKTKTQWKAIEEVRQGIAESATSLPHWGEQIPATWLQFEYIIQEKKEKKISSREEMIKFHATDDDFDDMLRFYHEIGIILFFPDEHLRNTIIVNIQWFIDSFKYIITDETHVSGIYRLNPEWQEFNRSGMLPESLLLEIWKREGRENYITYKDKIIPYMEKLGIVARMESSRHKRERHYYIPSINKIDLQNRDFIEQGNHTSILTFHFKTFLPHFFFYRLVVALFGIWKPAGENLLTKNAAFFDAGNEDEYHHAVVAVNKTSIQLQAYTRATTIPLKAERIIEIRKQVEKRVHGITSTFHKKADYDIGFHCPCLSVKITDDDEECFISEKELMKTKGKEIPCPNHHKQCAVINKEDVWKYWTMKDCYDSEVKCSLSPESKEDTARDGYIKKEPDRKTSFPKAKFRKEEDGCLKVKDQESFYLQKWHQSIGLLTCRTKTGTAFRVGRQYLMTAYHVIKDTVDFYLGKFIEFAQCHPMRRENYSKLLRRLNVEISGGDVEMKIRNGLESWLEKSGNKITFSDLIDALDVSGFSHAKDKASKLIEECLMHVDFNCKRELQQKKYFLKYDIPFCSETDDIAILEVIERDSFPCPPFALDISKSKPHHVHIVGYPSAHGSEEIFDPNCRLFSSKESWTQYIEAVQWWNDKYPREDRNKFKNAYDKAFSGDGKIQLNCSESTTHGASGSPGLILSDKEKPKVFLMLQEGFPSFVYGDEYKEELKIIPKKYLVESGISMSRVYELLSEKRFLELRNEIFHT